VAASSRPRSSAVADARAGRKSARTTSAPRAHGGWWETLRAFAGTVLLFLVIRAFLIEAFRIPSGA
jgi:hypothetical protein